MLVNGRITHAAISLIYPAGATIVGPEEELVVIEINGQSTNHKITSLVTKFENPLELRAGDVINFKSIKTVHSVTYATVNILIELDL